MAVKEQSAPTTIAVTPQRREAGFWSDAFRRLIRNKAAVVGGIVIILFFLMAIFADTAVFTIFTGAEPQPLLAPQSYESQKLVDNNAAPLWVTKVFPSMIPKGEEGGYVTISDQYTLGADDVGRDLLSRIIYGARVSLSVAIVGPFISLLIGVTFGMIAGYFGGRVDNLMMRFVDVMYAFPTLLLIILLMAFFRSTTSAPEPGTLRFYLTSIDNAMGGMFFIFVGIGITAWMSMARLTRGQILSLKEKEFIEAAHSMGAGDTRIMRRHILPNIVGPIIVAETLAIPTYIAYEAFLSFIGLGVNRPTPSWGALIADGSRAIRTYPNQVIFPALALAIIMFAFNFLGDGLRDALDPRLRGNQ
jgi:oligopeptide transport system permease protein